jgi:hypothetical protein
MAKEPMEMQKSITNVAMKMKECWIWNTLQS